MKRAVRDDTPKPGEPLTKYIDPHNQAVIDAELAERAERLATILTPRLLRRTVARYKALHRELNAAGWNALIRDREALHKEYQRLAAEWQRAQAEIAEVSEKLGSGHPAARALHEQYAPLRAAGRDVAQRGQALNAQIAELQPLADEFRELAARLASHEQAMQLEREEAENIKAFKREAYTWQAQMKAAFRRDQRLHYTRVDKKGRTITQTPKFAGIKFSEDKVLYRILTSSPGLFGTWIDNLPPNVPPRVLEDEDTLSRLRAATGRVVRVRRGERDQGFWYDICRPDSPDGIPKLVQYGKIIEWYPVERHARTPWCAGLTEDRQDVWYSFEDEPHILIAGSTRSGKSNLINQMIATLTSMNQPSEVQLVLIDNKGGVEFVHWSGLHHLLMPMIKEPLEVLPALKKLTEIMRKRQRMFEAALQKKLIQYNAAVADPLPRIIVFIDEMTTLLGLKQVSTEIQSELRLLSSQGAAFGIHLVLCTQHSSVDVLPGWTKTNMVLRAAGKMPSASASMTILDSGAAASISDTKGRFVFAVGREEKIVQTPLILDAQIARAVEISRSYAAPVAAPADDATAPPADPVAVALEAPEPAPLMDRDVFLRLAINQLGGALSPSRMFEIIDQRRIGLHMLRKIYKELIELDEIEFEGVRYYRRKIRQGHYLYPIEQPTETNDASSEGSRTHSTDLAEPVDVDGDTEEIETWQEV